ncbi:Hypothetical predicted protein [Olea europaea subsp. europaea]|uniref:Uncharacterized protein n=1 Tax=Olea europaea subsp. europaea TaxID=158383 RepID=A0A8S0SJ72_OLEEU|nr:Hypothetical predicted protein [Olea europaea subsp. europaea]
MTGDIAATTVSHVATVEYVAGVSLLRGGAVNLLRADWYNASPVKMLLRRRHRHFTTATRDDSRKEMCGGAVDLLLGGLVYLRRDISSSLQQHRQRCSGRW